MATISELELSPPYFRVGDDFAHYLEHAASIQDAIKAWGETLEIAGRQLKELAAELAGKKLDAEGAIDDAWLRGLTKEEEEYFAAKYPDIVGIVEFDEDEEFDECCGGACDCDCK